MSHQKNIFTSKKYIDISFEDYYTNNSLFLLNLKESVRIL